MTSCSFLHVADVHLDSPLAHLRSLDEATAARLQRATRLAIERIIQAAFEHQVAAVAIAGDLFDGPVRDAGAGLWIESQFKRLTREGIQVVLIRGNHDAVSNARRVTRWSEGIIELGAEKPQSHILDDVGLAFHGQSFGARSETADLAAKYPPARMGCFNVGLLHTSLVGSSQHDTYAPTSLSTLEGKAYDYWALGHIHGRSDQSLSDRTYIGYSGNTQGRHIREPGAKGCQLVKIRDHQLEAVEFLPTDSLRWHEIEVDMQPLALLTEIEEAVERQAVELLDACHGRSLALRIRLRGRTELHAELTRLGTLERLSETLSARLYDLGDIWLESLKVRSRPARASLQADLDLPLKYVSQVTDALRSDPENQQQLLELLEPLLRKSQAELSEYGWPLLQPPQQTEELTRLLQMAEDMLVSRLISDNAAQPDSAS